MGTPYGTVAGQRPSARFHWPAILIIAVGVLAYLNSLSGAFVFDDIPGIVENPHIRHLWPLSSTLTAPLDSPPAGRPMVALSLAINYRVGELQVIGYHVLNLLVHLLNGLLLYGVLRRTFVAQRWAPSVAAAARGLALSTTLLWLVHPLLTESVTYISQRTELLVGLFLLLTLSCAIRGATADRPIRWHVAAIVFCALGMASKEVMAAAPLGVMLYERIFVFESFTQMWRRRRRFFVGLMLTWGILIALTAGGPRAGTVGFHFQVVTPLDYARTQCGVLLHYLRLALWPHPLSVDYHDWPIARTWHGIWPAVVVIGALLGGTLWALWRKPWLGFFGAWCVLILAPSSSLVPIPSEIVAERRMYLPLAALMTLAVLAAWKRLDRLRLRPSRQRMVQGGLVLIGLVGLSVVTVRRNMDYATELSLWTQTAATHPNSSYAQATLCRALLEARHVEEAQDRCLWALSLEPWRPEAHLNLGATLAQQGRYDEAMAEYAQVVRLDATSAKAHNNWGTVLLQLGRPQEAESHFAESVRLDPSFAQMHFNLGNALARQERFDEAVQEYAESIRIQPRFADAHNNWGNVLLLQGQINAAREHYVAALRADPQHVKAANNLHRLASGAIPPR